MVRTISSKNRRRKANLLSEGAVKEVKAKVRTLRFERERGRSRTVRENHDRLAWLVQHAAATNNWHRIGED